MPPDVSAEELLRVRWRSCSRLCDHCRRSAKAHPEVLHELQIPEAEWGGVELFEGRGCVDCRNTGYRGRLAVHEVMPLSPTIRDMILDRAPNSHLKKQSMTEGHLTLRQDALIKLKKGITTAEEVLKETAPDRF